MNPQTKIVLIGGSGFIGNELSKALLAAGYSNICSLSRSKPKARIEGINYISGADITKPVSLAPHLADAEVIFNLAGLVSFHSRKKTELHDINAAGAKNVADICSRMPNLQRLIHVSSTAALGYSEKLMAEDHSFPWDSHQNLYYSHSKMMVNAALDCANVPTNIIFPPMVLGAGDEKNTGNIFKFVGDKRFLVVPPGSNSFIDVRDLAAGLMLVMEKAPTNENYIIASKAHSYLEIFKMAAKIQGNRPRIIILPKFFFRPAHYAARLLELLSPNLQAEQIYLGFKKREHDTHKIRELGFKPRYSLEDSLRGYLEKTRQQEESKNK